MPEERCTTEIDEHWKEGDFTDGCAGGGETREGIRTL